jgi:outer membrane protein insertion porin family
MGLKLERISLKDVQWYGFMPIDQSSGRSLKDWRERWSVLGTDEITTTTSLTSSLTRNTLDNLIFPTTGSRVNLSVELAGGLGKNEFYKGEIDASKFFPVDFMSRYFPFPFWQGSTVRVRTSQSIGGSFGNTHGLPIFERFFLGGDNDLRGYDYEDVGPKGVNPGADSIGGEYSSLLSAEFMFPIPLSLPYVKAIKGVNFLDMGDVFARGDAKDFFNPSLYRKSAGLGVRVLTPMGPVRLDWAYRLDGGKKQDDRRDDDDSGSSKLHFGFGSSF